MGKKILAFVIPITSCYPATSEASGILFADKSISNWMYNNFIQIFQVESNNAIDYYDFAIDNNPFLSYNEIDYRFIYNNWKSLCEFIIRCINDNYYVRLFNNMEKNSLYQNKADIQHDLLIYGYDEEEQKFSVADHFNNGKFEKKLCGFNELEYSVDTYRPELFKTNPAFLNCVQIIKKEKDMMRLRFSMYTPDEMDYILSLNLTRIIDSLDDYINGKPTINWYTRGRVMNEYLASSHKWGIQCYDILNIHINEYMNGIQSFSAQSFYLFYNHKLVMLERIKKIKDVYEWSDWKKHFENYKYLKELTNQLMLLQMKLQYVKEKIRLANHMKELIRQLKEIDYEYTVQLRDELKEYVNRI